MRRSKQIRVFISSTFQDMQQERDVLVKEVFPELRRRCSIKGLDFVEIDLRWGVTEEEAENGEVIPLCLKEIELCTYFVGILGKRYGWVPSDYPDNVTVQYPWLDAYKGRSLTEIEILHGVLNNCSGMNNSFFYFGHEERFVTADATLQPLIDDEDSSLERLKNQLRQDLPRMPRQYSDANSLGNVVLEDLWQAIEKDYPDENQLSKIELENQTQEAFGKVRERVFIGREGSIRKIDKYITNKSDSALVLTGESGCGKSSLVANWLAQHRKKHPKGLTFVHYLGSTPDSANPWKMMQRMLETFKEWEIWNGKVPSAQEEIESAWFLALENVASRGIVVAIDALNQVTQEGLDLNWLPWNIPNGVKLIVSVIPGDCLDKLRERQWTELEIPLLSSKHKNGIIADYLHRYGKKLPEGYTGLISDHKSTSNPLYLKLLLDELRISGDHDQLRSKLEWYLEAQTPQELYVKMLLRLEMDFDRNGYCLVKDAMTLIWASRDGLSENELIQVLGNDEKELVRNTWSPVYLGLIDYLALRDGRLTFFHDCLRQAVESFYINEEADAINCHVRLAKFFGKQKSIDQRTIQELPWQLLKSGQWEDLVTSITDIEMFMGISEAGLQEIRRYWQPIKEHFLGTDFDPTELYTQSLAVWEESSHLNSETLDSKQKEFYCRVLKEISTFLRESHSTEDSGMKFARKWLAFTERHYGIESLEYAKAAFKLGVILQYIDDPECLGLFEAALSIRKRFYKQSSIEIASCYYKIGETHSWLFGRTKKAIAFFEKALNIDREILGQMHYYVSNCLWNLGNEAIVLGDYEQASAYREESYQINRKVLSPRHRTFAMFLSDRAEILALVGEYDMAIEFAKQAISASDELNGSQSLFAAIYRRDAAEIYLLKRELGQAERLIQPWWDWWTSALEKNPSEARWQHAFARMARFKLEFGEVQQALNLIEKAFATRDEVKDSRGYHFEDNWLIRGRVQHKLGNRSLAREHLQQSLSHRIDHYGIDHPKTAEAYYYLAEYHHDFSEFQEAKDKVDKALTIRESKLRVDHPLLNVTRSLKKRIIDRSNSNPI